MFLSQAVGSFMGFLAPFLIIHTWLKIHMCQLLSAACVRHWVRFVVLSVAKGNTEEIITAAPHIFNQLKKKKICSPTGIFTQQAYYSKFKISKQKIICEF